MQAALYVLGGVFELAGITLAAAPDLVPGARRFSAWILPHARRFENRLRRVLHLRPRVIVHSVNVAGEINLAGSVDGMVSIDPEASLEEKVEFLLRRNQAIQLDTNALARRVAQIEDEASRQLAELRTDMESHVDQKLRAAAVEYRGARVVGAIALAIGLGLSTWGNFVGMG